MRLVPIQAPAMAPAVREFVMVDTRNLEDIRRDERMLMARLVERQGLSRDEAKQTVEDYRKGRPTEIDPLLMEGLDAL